VVDGFVVFGNIFVIAVVIPQAGNQFSVTVIEIAARRLEAFGVNSYTETSRSSLQHMQDYIAVVIDEGGAWAESFNGFGDANISRDGKAIDMLRA